MRFKNLLISFVIVLCICTTWSSAQTVETGHEAVSGTMNFTALAAYSLAHPAPLVIKEAENEEDDDGLTIHPSPTDSTTIHRRTGTGGVYGPTVPGGALLPVSPSPTDTFESTIDNITTIPPDTHGAVDSNYCVTTINSAVTIQTRAGGSVSSVSLDAFWTAVLPGGGSFDPRVHYDLYTHRWIVVAVSGAFSTSSSILIAISQTSNPTGSWYEFKVTADGSGVNWLDFPDVGYNNKWITVTGNLFTNSGGSFTNAKVFAFNKANLLAGTSAAYTAFNMADGSFTLCPALTYDASLGNMFFVESWNGTAGYMKIWKMTGAVGSESMSSVGFPGTTSYWWNGSNAYSGTFGTDFAPQAGTSNLVQTNDDRVDQVIFINGKLWFSHTVFLPYSSSANPTRSSVQWWQTDTLANPIQIGLIDDATGANFYAFPSLAVNTNDDVLIGFAAFSATTYPSGAYAMRLHTDPTDSIRPLDVFRHGVASYYKTYSGTKNRWGDYSGTCLDPLDQTNFWTIQEASTTPSGGYDRWDTYWANVLIPCSTPASITGTLNVCVGSTTTLADATSGGTWSSSSTAIATVGSTGIVTGASVGTATITYSTGTGCNATATVTVNALPTTITGTASVCVGSTTTLSSTPTGGTWSSATTGVATIGSGTGIVSGVSAGTSNITYTLSTGCLIATTVTVNTAPGAITGAASVCVGGTTTLSSSPGGGTWTSFSTGVATIGSSSGIASGVSAGTSNITYTLSGGCFSNTTLTVNANPGAITGTTTVCVGSSSTLSSSPGGGTWASNNSAIASVGTSSGSVLGVSAGNTTITYTLSGGCFATTPVTVNAAPTITVGSTVCVGSTIPVVFAPGPGTWSSSNPSVATIGSSGTTVLGVSAGTTTISYSLTSTGCFATATVTVLATPASITGSSTACVGGTDTLSSATGGGTWTSSNTGVATIGSGNGVVSGVSTGTTTITYTTASGCYVTYSVTVNPIGAISGPSSVCFGGTITLSDTSTGGSWTSGNATVATVGSGTGVVVGIMVGSSTLITYTLPSGCFATHAVTVTASPGAISGTATVCTGSTTTLSCSPGGGTWASGSTGVATVGSSSGIVSGVTPGTSLITYSLGTGCQSTTTITVNASPAIITGTANVCVGLTTSLSDATSGGAWSSSNANATVGTSGIVTGVTAGVDTILYTQGGCAASASVTVNATPASIMGSSSVCSGSTSTLSDATGGGSWLSSNPANFVVGSSSGIVTGIAAGCGTVTYTVGSCYATLPFCDLAAPSAISGPSTVCVGSTITLSDATGGGSWSSSNTAIATASSTSGVVVGVSSGTANISYILPTGCFAIAPVTVNPLPTITLGANPSVTAGTTSANLPYSATTGSPSTYSIVYSAAAHTAGFADVTAAALPSAPIVLTVPGAAPSAIYSATLTVTGTCTSTGYPISVTITPSVGGGVWAPLTTSAPHANGGVMLVMTDGTIMCKTDAGGSGQGTLWDILTPDSHGSYLNGTWTTTAAMANDRLYFSSQVLQDGRVYVAGGEYGAGGSLAEVYNPVANTWSTATTSAGTPFLSDCNSEILPDGTILEAIQSGTTRGNYIYNATANTATATGTCFGSHDEAAWIKLPDSSILQVDILSTNSERYIPSTGAWIHDAACPVMLYDSYGLEAGGALLMPNGKVFFLGATGHTAIYTPSGSTANGSWVAGPDIPNSEGTPDAPCAMMVNGKVLLCASPLPRSSNHFPDSTSFYEYDYSTNSYTLVTTPLGGTIMSGWPTFISNMVDLPDGNVLYSYQSGGYYIYTPTGSAIAGGQPTVNSILRVNCDTFTATGTLFNGISEGSSYGDDWQNASNYPIIRLTSGANVYYAKVYNWNSTGVKRGAALDTVQFILPAGLPAGSYTLAVVANGNASAGTPFNAALTISPATPSVCVGSTVTLSDAWTGGTWASGSPLIASVGSSTGIVAGVAAGTATITYTFSGGCTATVNVTVTAAPSAITGTTAICIGNTSALASAPGGGTWTSTATAVATIGSASGVVTGVSAGTSDITYTLSGGCFANTTVTVSAAVSAITGTADVCVGLTTPLNDVTPGGTWGTSDATIATVGAGTGIVTGVAWGAATISYTVGSCSATIPVTVDTFIAFAGISGGGIVSVGGTLALTDAVSGGTWSSSGANATVGSATGIVTGVTVGTVTISYGITNGCGADYSTRTVTVVPTSCISPISGPASVCAGSSVTLTDTTSGGVWSSANTAIATVGSATGVVTGIVADTVTIIYSVGPGCVATKLVTVNISAAPITGLLGTCTGGTTTLADATPGGTWSSSNPAIATIGSATGFVNGITPGSTVITYSLGAGCAATRAFVVHPVPAPVAVIGGGGYCAGGAGVNVGITGSAMGISYQLYRGGVAVGAPLPGIGGMLYFGLQTVAGVYTVVGTDTITMCSTTMTGSATVSIYLLPNIYTVTGGGSYCSGGTGVVIGLSNSDVGFNYQLYRGGLPVVGTITAGTGAAISFGLQTAAGVYTVVAKNTGFTACTALMSGSATITINPLPNVYAVTGGGGYCTGGTGVLVGLSNSDLGVNYQLYHSGVAVGAPVAGAGAAVSFGLQVAAGTYTVVATNATTGCVSNMSGSATVIINPLPTVYAVTGGGTYCAGGTGVVVGLSASSFGVNYQLYRGVTAVGSPVAGTGAGISFGLQTVAGTYTVVATNATTGCVNNMSGSATVSTTSLPNVYSVTGGGSYCAGGVGVHVGLSNSDIGTSYQLYLGASAVGSPMAGTGAPLDFGLQTAAGTYTVVATITGTACSINMSGSATVTITPLPIAYVVTGGGGYCAGGTGVTVGLSGSQVGVVYTLYDGAIAVAVGVGSGTAISFGVFTAAGIYTVVADAGTPCANVMTGSVTITINPLPTIYTVTGGGSYCTGGSGVVIGLSGSQSGVNYQLFNGASPVGAAVAGTGIAITFGTFTVAGTYTVVAANAITGCTDNMSGSATIIISSLPNVYAVTGGGSYCSGGTGVVVGLSNSDVGVNYQLFISGTATGSPVAGVGGAISFGLQTSAATYTVVATNATTGCTIAMSGSATITINPLPAVVSVTGGGGYCAGGSGVVVGLSASAAGINYQLYLGGVPLGSPVAGTGAAISFGLQTVAGTYTVVATNATTGCTSNMSGSAIVTINPLPNIYAVTGGGSYCSGGTGVVVGLGSSDVGVNYQLYLGGLPIVGTITAGTGVAISFGLRTAAGVYTVVATSAGYTGCADTMSGSATISINPLPSVYTVTGGGAYCVGGSGVLIGLSNSDIGITYALYQGGVLIGTASGTGAPFNFGTFLAAGTYTVVATNAITGCTDNMSGSATITINPLPTVYAVTGGGSYCAGGAGVAVGLMASTFGINYQLYRGGVAVGSPVAGTGAGISFGLQTVAGTYTVVATNATTGCVNNMSGSAVVSVTALPNIYTLTGGGSYCTGGTGLHVGLSNSDVGTSYQLYRSGTAIGSPVAGTGIALDFGLQTTAGTYTAVAAITGTLCTINMSGSAVITVNPLPTVYNVIGGGGYCVGGVGVHVKLSGSNTGINYQLFNGAIAVGSPMPGTGTFLDFGLQTVAGTYTVVAANSTTSCTDNMAGSVTITINPLPTVYTVTGGGAYCSGGSGVPVGLSSSQAGVNYRLYLGGVPIGSPVAGTGIAISFGLRTVAGVYTVVATNATTGCTSNMSGSATVTVNPLPNIYTVTGGGSYCSGGTGVNICLSNGDAGISYQLYRGTAMAGSPILGTGVAFCFPPQTVTGTYTIVATNTATGCTATMSGSATVTITSLPAAIPVTGGGSYCAGGAGVHVGLAGSVVGVSYQLIRGATPVGSPLAGTGAPLDFGLQTIAGTYTVVGTNTTTGCSNNMTGSVTVTINPVPIAYTVTGGGSYCAGGPGLVVGLGNSTSGVKYRLYRGGTAIGTYVYGTGASISFGLQTSAGTYTVVATDLTTGCTANMTGSVTITINPLPTVYNVIGGGSFCAGGAGVHVKLSGSGVGINYQLYLGGVALGSPMPGTGALLDYGLMTGPGTYTVVAVNATTGCTNNMAGSVTVTVNPLPTAYTVTGGGSYCSGPGVHVGLNGSNTGIHYQLYRGGTAVGIAHAGTGIALDFGAQTISGTYTVVATNTATGCTSNMTGSAVITVGTPPTAFTVTGGGSYCAGGTGFAIGLNGSTVGISYQLYLGATSVGTAVPGTGVAISFGVFTTAGTYTVVATNTTTGCTATMTGSATIIVSPLPTAFNVTGGGTYCTGGSGVHIGLSGSVVGVSYQLFRGATPIIAWSGFGGAIDFGLYTTTGTYTVVATNTSTSCTAPMTGSAVVGTTTAPTAYTVTGGGAYCSGGTGVTVGLAGSQIGVTYQLYIGGVPTGSPVAGTGSALNFGLHTTAGTYTVVATATGTSCTSNMTGSVTITVNALPTIDTVTGGGTTCSAGPGVHVGLNTSTAGVSYQLLRSGTTVGSPLAGTGASLDFGPFMTAGTYTVFATNTTTGCSSGMYGSATVIIATSPAVISMTGGGAYCAGGAGVHIGLAASVIGVNYQLYLGGSPVGAPVAGIGAALDFGLQTTAGTYTATGTYAGTSCSSNMSGSETVTVFAVPTVDTVTGGGSYCSGGSGVHIGLNTSSTGISYKLFLTGTPVIAISGTGAPLDFGLYTSAGTYTIVATNTSTGCTSNMYGSATITINPNPVISGTIYTVAPAGTITLTGSISGGTWTSTDTTIATIGSSSGVVTGVSLGTIVITYTLSTGCWGAHTVAVTPTGHRENPSGIVTIAGSSNISVTPNPNHGTFTVKGTLATTDDEELNLEITNMLGQVVYSEKVLVQNGELDKTIQVNGALANGMYLLTLRSASENQVFHIVVEQ